MAQIKRQYSIPTVTIIYELHRNKSLVLTLTLTLLTLNPIYCWNWGKMCEK